MAHPGSIFLIVEVGFRFKSEIIVAPNFLLSPSSAAAWIYLILYVFSLTKDRTCKNESH